MHFNANDKKTCTLCARFVISIKLVVSKNSVYVEVKILQREIHIFRKCKDKGDAMKAICGCWIFGNLCFSVASLFIRSFPMRTSEEKNILALWGIK